MGISCLPTATATLDSSPFPEITFMSFSSFIQQNFAAEISLSTVLMMLFTMTENPDLLSLHARQQYSHVDGENISSINSWIKALSRGVYTKMNGSYSKLLHGSDFYEDISENNIIGNLAVRLDKFAHHLDLVKFNKKGYLKTALKPISYKAIEAIYIIHLEIGRGLV
jgi:hypothetical protein